MKGGWCGTDVRSTISLRDRCETTGIIFTHQSGVLVFCTEFMGHKTYSDMMTRRLITVISLNNEGKLTKLGIL